MSEKNYILGYTKAEYQRLILQSHFIQHITEQLLYSTPITTGMTVLDLGCGVGDVSFLLAKIVGPTGKVIAYDQSEESLGIAHHRAQELGLHHIEFRQADLEQLTLTDTLDAIVGRLILLYLNNPAATINKLLQRLTPGGIVAFQEIDISSGYAIPSVDIYTQALHWITEAYKACQLEPNMGSKLGHTLLDAGLNEPNIYGGTRIEIGKDSPIYPWVTQSLYSLAPVMEQFSIATSEEINTFEQYFREQAQQQSAQLYAPTFVSAWTQV